MKSVLIAIVCAAACAAAAQTEADINSYAEQGLPEVKAGRLDPLTFYRELYRRIAITPASEYRWKAENLRIIGQRVDIYEDVQAGKISPEKAQRMLLEQSADVEQAETARRDQAAARQQAEELARQQAAMQAEAQRRALAMQLLQGGLLPKPYQGTPYVVQPAPQVHCNSYIAGNSVQTNCQ